MAAVSEIIVREFFEMHGFLVSQRRKYMAVGRQAEEDIDFFVSNPRPAAPFTKLLVVPALPRDPDALEQTVALLRSKGVDAVVPFHTILRGLIDNVEINRNYQKSDLLQTLRILKNYEFFKETQLELFKSKRKPRQAAAQSEPPLPRPSSG